LFYTFDIYYRSIGLFFIGLLGCCYLLMAIFQYLPKILFLIVCLIIIAGHNLLDGVKLNDHAFSSIVWYILHQQKYLAYEGRVFIINYTLLPWFAIFGLGYLSSSLYGKDMANSLKSRAILACGILLLSLFFILRLTQFYGEPNKLSIYPDFKKTLISFFSLTKYPASLCYLSITLGITLLILAVTPNQKNWIVRSISLLGRNFLSIYLSSTFLIHLTAMFVLHLSGGKWSAMIITEASYLSESPLNGWGYSLLTVYIIWALIAFVIVCSLKKQPFRFCLYVLTRICK
jgi:uncharacterized membrane protein